MPRRSPTTSEFVSRSKLIHGDLYDYSKTEYVNSGEKVEIICTRHGSFWMSPSNHTHKTRPQGCRSCGKERAAEERLEKGRELFSKLAKEVHGDKYDFSSDVWAFGCILFEMSYAHTNAKTKTEKCIHIDISNQSIIFVVDSVFDSCVFLLQQYARIRVRKNQYDY